MTTESDSGAGSGISATVMTRGVAVLRAVGAARVRQAGWRCADGVVRQLDVIRLPIGGVEHKALFLGGVPRDSSDRLPLSIWACHMPHNLLAMLVELDGIERVPFARQLPPRRRMDVRCSCRRCRAVVVRLLFSPRLAR